MYAIFKRELKNYFLTPVAYVFMAPFIVFMGIYFVMMLSFQQADVSYIVSSTNMLCLFTVPILTMQLFAEERNKKTEHLLNEIKKYYYDKKSLPMGAQVYIPVAGSLAF